MIELHVHASQSLKQKRGVVRSIQRRVRNRFNLSVAEGGGQGTWQRATLGLSAAGSEAGPVRSALERAIVFIEELHLAEVLGSDVELLTLPHEASADIGAWDLEPDDEDQPDEEDEG